MTTAFVDKVIALAGRVKAAVLWLRALSGDEKKTLYALLFLAIVSVLVFVKAAFCQDVPIPSQAVAIALQYHDANNLMGANVVKDTEEETMLFNNVNTCVMWAHRRVAKEKHKTIGFGCLPIPSPIKSDVLPDSSGLKTTITQVAVAFEYGTTHQLVKIVVLGVADDNSECVRVGHATLESSKIRPGWVVVISCLGVPPFPPATGTV